MKPRAKEEKMAPYEAQPGWTADGIELAVNQAVDEALQRHRERGESVVMWIDGKVVRLKPGEY
jgi:hypothetical protein